MLKREGKFFSSDESFLLFEALFNSTQLFLVLANKENHVLMANDKMNGFFGNLDNIEKFVHKNILPADQENPIKTSIESKVDDQPLVIHWNVSCVKNEHQEIYKILVGNEVSELEQLKKQNDVLNYIIKKVPGYVFWKDKNSALQGCNENFARQVGFKETEDVIGKTDRDLPWTLEETKAFLRDDQEIMRTGKSKLNIEERQRQLDGHIATLLTNKVPMKDLSGNINGILGIYIDITELKETQAALKQAKEQAELANKVKTEFIANMSHDIRTPITGMLGLTQEIIDQTQDPLIREDGELLIGATDELLQLLNEIIEIVKIESGKMMVEPESFDLAELVERNINLFRPAAQHKSLKIMAKMASGVPQYVYGYRFYLDRILLNLLSNATKFTAQGHVTVSVKGVANHSEMSFNQANKSATEKTSLGALITLQITIEDTGIGIPEDKYETIFEHFSRLTASYQGIYKGSGLGLYTVKRYLEAMNGKIQVESEEGKGSRFIVTLPFKVATHSDYQRQSVLAPGSKSMHPVEKAKSEPVTSITEPMDVLARVLVVEDNPLATKMVAKILHEHQCAADIATTGAAALKQLNAQDYDLIFMDLGLPDISGLKVTQKIRTLSDMHRSQVPIVVLTGHVDAEKRAKCEAAGVNDMLTKPIHSLAVESMLQRFVFKTTEEAGRDKAVKPVEKEDLLAIDLAEGMRLVEGDETLAREILDMFADSLKKDWKQLTSVYATGDMHALYMEVHKFYGGLCYVGAPRLRSATQALRRALKEGNHKLITSCYDALVREIEMFWKTYKK